MHKVYYSFPECYLALLNVLNAPFRFSYSSIPILSFGLTREYLSHFFLEVVNCEVQPLRCDFRARKKDRRGKDSHRSPATAFQPPRSLRDGKDAIFLKLVEGWILSIYYVIYSTIIEL